MNWFGRKFRNAPNEMLSVSTGEPGDLGQHLGEWVDLGTEPHDEITLVTSMVHPEEPGAGGLQAVHAPVLDLDLEHVYYESSTPGHAALLLNVELTWEQYKDLLDVLHDYGIIQTGFHQASLQRGYSACRTPWTKKIKPEPCAEAVNDFL